MVFFFLPTSNLFLIFLHVFCDVTEFGWISIIALSVRRWAAFWLYFLIYIFIFSLLHFLELKRGLERKEERGRKEQKGQGRSGNCQLRILVSICFDPSGLGCLYSSIASTYFLQSPTWLALRLLEIFPYLTKSAWCGMTQRCYHLVRILICLGQAEKTANRVVSLKEGGLFPVPFLANLPCHHRFRHPSPYHATRYRRRFLAERLAVDRPNIGGSAALDWPMNTMRWCSFNPLSHIITKWLLHWDSLPKYSAERGVQRCGTGAASCFVIRIMCKYS